ncbi:MAG: ABC transporter permease [Deltaproteobacteria bacterium]|nr:ABC transporter permease [Deltaproteobacteria bacterium]
MNKQSAERVWRLIKDLPLAAILLLLPVTVCGLLGQFFIPHDPGAIDPSKALRPPSWLIGAGWSHLFGTDYLGRDVFSRVIMGAQASLLVSFVGVGLAGLFGITLGLLSAYFRSWVDTVVVMLIDIQRSMPAILLALLLSAALGSSGLGSVVIVVAIIYWTHYAMVVRGETLSVKQRDYVVMARVLGATNKRILAKHIFPNVIDSALVVASLQLGSAIMLEAMLSFLGMGVQPPAVAWGKMIAESRLYIATAWWLPTFPGIALVITVLGANLFGDWLRDRLDPKLRQV